MSKFIGYIEMANYEPTIFFNFKPIAELRGTTIHILTSDDQDDLLPDSDKRDINLSYSFSNVDQRNLMDKYFCDQSLAVFDFDVDDLLPNMRPNGDRNPTGYKVQAIDMINAGKIRFLHEEGVYHVVRADDLVEQADFFNDNIVEIETPYILENEKVIFVLNDMLAGPYTVGFRELTNSYYIKPQIKEAKYTVNGYDSAECKRLTLECSETRWGSDDYTWEIAIPKDGIAKIQKDVITDDILIESFKDSLANSNTINSQIQIDSVPALLERYEKSYLSGELLTPAVCKNRLNRLVELLTSEVDVDETLSTVADFICDLLVRQKDDPAVEEWTQSLLKTHPDLFEQLRDSRVITERLAKKEQIIEDLQQQRSALEQEIRDRKEEALSIDAVALEAKKTALLEMDAEYQALVEKLDSVKETLGIAEEITDLNTLNEKARREAADLDGHKRLLENETSILELQFQELISKPHEKMVGIAFDGFMSSKMLNAASQWEAEQCTNAHNELVKQVNSISCDDMSPEDLIAYLCHAVQIVRPNYSRNTIVNIAISLTQSFLTVFSGEPGCGKTSICNIFGEVLGLNNIEKYISNAGTYNENISRFVPVSVERGWTSKRDFIGYFNPLSKRFDKSNRNVYDALHQLDTENKSQSYKLPYIILLDEANLSPLEYYWSDFMNICDDLGPNSKVNLGEDYIFTIPETLHFLATINNDDTTTVLSPRLVDRACVITLPQQNAPTLGSESIPANEIRIVTWPSLKNAFIPSKADCIFPAEIQKGYDSICTLLKETHLSVSPRTDMAIRRYWGAASKHFSSDETGTDPATVALDYAIAQRILPKIHGNTDEFGKWLEKLRSTCSSNGFNISAKILKDIIERGKDQMNYYRFFS